MIKLLILDFDGVLVESVDIKTEAFRELFQGYKDKVDEIVQYHIKNHAFSRYAKFKYIYENILGKEYTSKVERDLGRRFSEIVFQKVAECPSVEGAEEFLEYFSKIYPIYLASNTPQQELERIIVKRKMKKYFKQIFGCPPGNKVDFINKAIENEHAKPNEAIYIGDMMEDYNIAKKTGVFFIGRRNIESFDNLDIPQFSNLKEIKKWIMSRKINEKYFR